MVKTSYAELLKVFGPNVVTICTSVPNKTSLGAMIEEALKLKEMHPGFLILIHKPTLQEEKKLEAMHKETSDFLKRLDKFEKMSRRKNVSDIRY